MAISASPASGRWWPAGSAWARLQRLLLNVVVSLAVLGTAVGCGTDSLDGERPSVSSGVSAVGAVESTSASGSLPSSPPPSTTAQASPAPPAGTDPDDAAAPPSVSPLPSATPHGVRTGADVLVAGRFAPLQGLRVGLIANQASTSGGRFMLDLLHEAAGVTLAAVFAPEHGVRGTAGAGEDVGDTDDPATGVPVISLYKPGSGFRPTPGELAGIDVLVYDLQDVGTRFYTYISTMGRCMEAAAQAGIPFIVLDRPNPSGGDVVEGFLRTSDQDSFISEYPIPARYGLTSGELATMILGQGWKDVAGLDLRIIDLVGWRRSDRWEDTTLPWVPPSPGLPTVTAALTYPGTVLLEATTLSFGRGTREVFTVAGAPWVDGPAVAAELNERALPGVAFEATTFVPQVIPGMAEDPDAIPFLGQTVPGVRVVVNDPVAVRSVAMGVHLLEVFRNASLAAGQGELISRGPTLDLLAGTASLRRLLGEGADAQTIIDAWSADVDDFQQQRAAYLRY